MPESKCAPLLRKLEFVQIPRPPSLRKDRRIFSIEGTPVRKGPRSWIVERLPAFFRVTGAITMTVAIDDEAKWWIAFKSVPLEIYNFTYVGSAASFSDSEE